MTPGRTKAEEVLSVMNDIADDLLLEAGEAAVEEFWDRLRGEVVSDDSFDWEQTVYVARYVIDLGRNEPRNFGVVCWQDGQLGWRFVDEADFVMDSINFVRWTDYWTGLFQSPEVQIQNRRPVPRESKRFLSEIARTSEGNYALEPSRVIRHRYEGETMEQFADAMFERLVLPQPTNLTRRRRRTRAGR